MLVEFNPRSESFSVWATNEDEHNFMKLIASPAFHPYEFLKCYQNSIYGKMVSDIGIDEKENNMRKDFIVVHCGDNQPKIIRKDAIIVVDKMKGVDGEECRVWLTSGDCFLVMETYNEIVRRIFE